MIETKNFNPISDPKLLCTCGHPECDKRSVSQKVLNKVQTMRYEAGRPLRITSGGRCPHHPNEVDRTTPADHQKCQAVDIYVNNALERGEIVDLALKHGFNAIGVAKNFVHIGLRSELEWGEIIMWVY